MSHGFPLERDPSELKKAKPVEENGEQEAEPVRNGAESVSEGEGTDANSGFTESSSEAPVYQYKPGKSCFGLLCARLVFCYRPVHPPRFQWGWTGVQHLAMSGPAGIHQPTARERPSGGAQKGNCFSRAGGSEEKRKSPIPCMYCPRGCWLQHSGNGGESVPLWSTAESDPRNSI